MIISIAYITKNLSETYELMSSSKPLSEKDALKQQLIAEGKWPV
jgi:hypothetical protein